MRFNPHKWLDRINRYVQRAIGRHLGADAVEFVFLPRPRLTIEGLTISNPDWSDRPHFLRLDKVVGEIQLRPLLKRRLVFSRVWVYGGAFSFEYGPDGLDNWMFDGTAVADDEDIVLPEIHQLFVEDLHFPVIDPATGLDYRMRFDKGVARMDSPDGPAQLDFRFDWGAAGEKPSSLHVGGVMTSWQDLFDGRPVDFDATFSGYDMVLTGKGQWHQTVIDAHARLVGPSLSRLSTIFDSTVMDSSAFSLEADLGGDLVAELVMSQAQLAFDHSSLAGDITLNWQDDQVLVSGAAHASMINMADFGEEQDSGDDTRLVPDIDLDWTGPGFLDWALDLRLDRFLAGAWDLQNITGQLKGTNGKLTVSDLAMDGYGGAWQGQGNLSCRARPALYHLDARADSVMLEDFMAIFDVNLPVNGPAKAVADVKMRGTTLRHWADTVTGDIEISLEDGVMHSRLFDFLGGELLRTALGKLQDSLDARRGTKVDCLMAAWRFDKGVGTSKLTLIDTKHMTMYVEGSIDLREERLDLLLTPKAKQPGLSLGTPLHVFGPLHKPNVVPDPTALARKAAGLAVGVATIGAGLMLPLPSVVMRNLASEGLAGETAEDRARRLDADRHKNRNAADMVEHGIEDAVKTTIKGVDFALKTLLGPGRRNR